MIVWIDNNNIDCMQNKTPFKFLLDQNRQSPNSVNKNRSEEEIEILSELIVHNHIFGYLGLSKQYTREICEKITLIWADNPHINNGNEGEIYLVLNGKAFEYMHNKSASLKAKLHENNDYIMVRKLVSNDFFIEFSPPRKYSGNNNKKKYHLMVDQQTLLGKISGQLFHKLFFPALESNWRKINSFAKKVNLLSSLPNLMIYELSKYFSEEDHPKGTFIIKKEEKSPYIYFIQSGQVQFRTFNVPMSKVTPHKNYKTSYSKTFQRQILKEFDVFGMDTFNPSTYEEVETDYSAETRQETLLYKIDKRILAIVISSFDELLNKNTKVYSSINLNDQIKGQGHQTPDMAILTRNAQLIKTSQRKIRDIKLRYLTAAKKSRNLQKQNTIAEEDHLQFLESKYESCHSLPRNKTNLGDQMKFSQTFNVKSNQAVINNFNNTFRSLNRKSFVQAPLVQPKVNHIIFSAYHDSQTPQKKKITQPQTQQNDKNSEFTPILAKTKISGFLQNKRKSDLISYGREESDVIRAFIEKKQKYQMSKKAELILQRNTSKKQRSKSQVKRMFNSKSQNSLKRKRAEPIRQEQQKRTLGDELYERMNRIHENPLLSLIQSERRKLEYNTKLSQRKSRGGASRKQSRKSTGLILITNN